MAVKHEDFNHIFIFKTEREAKGYHLKLKKLGIVSGVSKAEPIPIIKHLKSGEKKEVKLNMWKVLSYQNPNKIVEV